MSKLATGFVDSRVTVALDSQQSLHRLRVGDYVLAGTIPDYAVRVCRIENARVSQFRLRLHTKIDGHHDVCLPRAGQVLIRRKWERALRDLPKTRRLELEAEVCATIGNASLVLTPAYFEYVCDVKPGDWVCAPYYTTPKSDSQPMPTLGAPLYSPNWRYDWSTPLERLCVNPWYTRIDRSILIDGAGLWHKVAARFSDNAVTGISIEVDSAGSVIIDRLAVRADVHISQTSAKS